MSVDRLVASLQPLLTRLAALDVGHPADTAAILNREFPLSAPAMTALRRLVREGVDARWLCDRENSGVRYSRVVKAVPGVPLSVDAVHMSVSGAAHLHPAGELDLCFAVTGDPRFDGRPEGWVVYPPNTWHVPTVQGGAMDILYFLPQGQMRFGDCPPDAIKAGLQAI